MATIQHMNDKLEHIKAVAVYCGYTAVDDMFWGVVVGKEGIL